MPGLLIHPDAEGGIFLRQALQSVGQFILVGLGLGLDGDGDHRIRKLDGFQDDRRRSIAQRLTGERLLQADDRADITGAQL